MKWSFATVGLIVLGLIGIGVIMLFQQLTTSSENDYYLLKEITNAAMVDSIDIAYYRETGDLKIVREKFVENFTRRYSESTLFIGTKYVISFYDIMEIPPKVTVLINTGFENYRIYNNVDTYNVQNTLTGILEYIGKNTKTTISEIGNNDSVYTKDEKLSKTYYSMPKVNENGKVIVNQPINIPKELDQSNIKITKLEIKSEGATNKLEDILKAKLWRDIDWAKASSGEIPTNYYTEIDVGEYTTNCDVKNIACYDCSTGKGTADKIDGMCTEKYKDKIWIYWDGTSPDTNKTLVLKLNVTFTYDEYEY